ncbi:hypothetical protein [Sphingobacterium sp. BIGb0165]|uniref:hypothetical protein n=1 Tax=Sphingobacterium sp. BIGb0165 TaxID=2940615 RepID=UPI0021675D28|nr:hypothetical protein [Sphingobacterium sp. BIGb0165]MCS4226346.1 hypothetical protein [Sphingobacterium sp. BIGb0165]
MSVVAVAVMSSTAFAGTGKAPSYKTVETKALSEKVEAPKMVHTSADGKRSIEMVEIKTANTPKMKCVFKINYYVNGEYDGSVTITANRTSCGEFFCTMRGLL